VSTKTKLLNTLAFGALTVIAASCWLNVPEEPVKTVGNYQLSEVKTFYAQRMDNSTFYQLNAKLMAIGTRCTVWVETTQNVSVAAAQSMAAKYDNTIYPMMMNTYGYYADIRVGGATVANNTMELADWYADGDGKFAILLLDIKDGYTPGGGYVAGYYTAGNLFQQTYSNGMDMIYVDTYPGTPGSDSSNSTLAHEMQHHMNSVNGFLLRDWKEMDIWINEGLSTAAEYLYWKTVSFNPHIASGRYGWFVNDSTGNIRRGNNFYVWDYGLDEYATAYMFFQWLRTQVPQAVGTGIYKSIAMSTSTDYHAVTGAANYYMPGNGYDDWGTLLQTWMAANYINASSGKYGYNGEFNNSLVKTFPTSSADTQLRPGEGVYSKSTTNTPLPVNSINVKYAGLKADGTVSSEERYAGGVMLTYNKSTNTSIYAAAETGTLTGSASIEPMASLSFSVNPQDGAPYIIDARDMLARNGHDAAAFGAGFTFTPPAGEMPVIVNE
jgi:hypothetical protein